MAENPRLTRPCLHFTPPAHWLNDPNGLVWFEGEYHLFYQHHPHSDVWGPMHWGHAVSRDLVNWSHLPIALFPDEHGLIFSGSAVADKHNTAGFGEHALVAMFTCNKNYRESQNLAYSLDKGRTWTKYAGNPVIPAPEPVRDFRDPKVFWHEDRWVMALAAGNSIEFFKSPDLKNWERTGTFGGGEYGSTSGVWETPDLFQLPLDDGGTRWVLTVGVGNGAPARGSGTQYFIGHFDGQIFVSENPKETIRWADFGPDYYAPQSWNDAPGGRRLMLGWMSNWQYAAQTPTAGWRGAFSLIREMSLAHAEGGLRLAQRPIPELQSLRGEYRRWRGETLRPGENLLADVRGDALEILLDAEAEHDFGLRVRMGAGEQTTIRFSAWEGRLSLDRTHSGQTHFKEGFAGTYSASVPTGRIRLHIFVDASSVEVFANDGLTVISALIFPSAASPSIDLLAEGGEVTLHSLEVHQLHPARFQHD